MHKVCCVIAQISSVYVRIIPKIYTKNLPLQPFPTTKKDCCIRLEKAAEQYPAAFIAFILRLYLPAYP